MAESVDIPVVETPPVAEQATVTSPVVNPDGTFTDAFRESLSEDIRNEPCLNNVKSLSDLATQHVNMTRNFGKDKMVIPNENSSESDWETFHKIGGMPETPQDYNLKRPDDYPEELFSDELATKAQDLFHKIGLSTKQAEALMQFNLNATLGAHTTQVQTMELQQKEAVDSLSNEWGAAYDQKLHLGNIALEQAVDGNEEFRERIKSKFGNDSDFIKFASNLGAKLAESTGAPTNIPTPADVQDEIIELTNTAAYRGGPGVSVPEHDAAVAKMARLFKAKNKHLEV